MKKRSPIKFLLAISIAVFMLTSPINNLKAQQSKRDSIIFYYLDTISYYLDSLDVQEQPYVLAQAIWETGWFQCNNCAWSKGHNLFGFRGQNGYIKYNSWVESVVAYSKWQNRRYIPYKKTHPNSTYLNFIVWSKYADEPSYTAHIQTIYNWLIKNWYNKK
jgi:flagellum-specific peptidoglycan hydrolase FlgJ